MIGWTDGQSFSARARTDDPHRKAFGFGGETGMVRGGQEGLVSPSYRGSCDRKVGLVGAVVVNPPILYVYI